MLMHLLLNDSNMLVNGDLLRGLTKGFKISLEDIENSLQNLKILR
jgi:hypothetical protein